MKKVLKWIGVVLGGLIGVIIFAVLGLSLRANARLNKTYQIQPETVTIPADLESIAEGERLASFYCTGCHGTDLGGTDFFSEPALAMVDTPNLTSGNGGIGNQYGDADWVRAIRHGVDPQGKPLFIMPAKDFYYLSDEDLGQIIAFLKTLPPVDNASNDFSFTIMGRVLLGAGVFGDVLNAETIDHAGQRPESPVVGVTKEYGEYLINTIGCRTCHGQELSGGQDPAPGAPPGPNLTPGGHLDSWTEATFITTVRTRKSEWMPFESLAKMSDDELRAIWTYLQALPELETTTN
ncbi:MAG: c-type cytochrome [Anaerolineales bacterium]|jgi:mono/diheme cytochrome c family protein